MLRPTATPIPQCLQPACRQRTARCECKTQLKAAPARVSTRSSPPQPPSTIKTRTYGCPAPQPTATAPTHQSAEHACIAACQLGSAQRLWCTPNTASENTNKISHAAQQLGCDASDTRRCSRVRLCMCVVHAASAAVRVDTVRVGKPAACLLPRSSLSSRQCDAVQSRHQAAHAHCMHACWRRGRGSRGRHTPRCTQRARSAHAPHRESQSKPDTNAQVLPVRCCHQPQEDAKCLRGCTAHARARAGALQPIVQVRPAQSRGPIRARATKANKVAAA